MNFAGLSNSNAPFKTKCYIGDRLYIAQVWKTLALARAAGENWKLSGTAHRYEIVEARGNDTGRSKQGGIDA